MQLAHPAPITDIIRQRFSCRSYSPEPLAATLQQELQRRLERLQRGPLGTPARFTLIAANPNDSAALRGLGTYGFIRNPTGFLLGALQNAPQALEDYGYLMEEAVLEATALGLGTCWLGGSFTRSSFGQKIGLQPGEILPAVTATGMILDETQARNGLLRRQAKGNQRLAWGEIFFAETFTQPLPRTKAGAYAKALDMVRLAPSASNKQPWRVIRSDTAWHFYLQRTPGYGKGSLTYDLLKLADLQRVDLGIAMCHFELTTRELGLAGEWQIANPGLSVPNPATEYTVSWVTSD